MVIGVLGVVVAVEALSFFSLADRVASARVFARASCLPSASLPVPELPVSASG